MTENKFMRAALELAKQSALEGEVPVGAVIVKDGEIVGTGRNRREYGKNALYHAEIEAINSACKKLGGWRLWQCDMYVTLEPCPMCAGAIIQARIPKVVVGAMNKKAGCAGSVLNLFQIPQFNHQVIFENGILEEECSEMLSDFFKQLRKKKDI